MRHELILIALVVALLLTAGVVQAATLVPQKVTTSGIVLTPVAPVDLTNQFPNRGRSVLWINNDTGGAITYEVAIPGTVAGFSLENITGTVVTGTAKFIGPFNPTYANNAAGNVEFTLSVTASVEIAVLEW